MVTASARKIRVGGGGADANGTMLSRARYCASVIYLCWRGYVLFERVVVVYTRERREGWRYGGEIHGLRESGEHVIERAAVMLDDDGERRCCGHGVTVTGADMRYIVQRVTLLSVVTTVMRKRREAENRR